MHKAEHIIKSHQYHIELDKQEDAHQVQSNISILQETRINELLDNILSKYSNADNIYQFDKIELDLGVIRKSNYENEILFRLEEELNNFFNSNIRENGTLRNGKVIKLNNHKLEQFEHFILRGYLKWDSFHSQTPTNLLLDLIAENSTGLINLLSKHWKTESVRKRVIFQFDEEPLENITYAIAKTDSKYIISYKRNILEHQKKNHFVDTEYSTFRNAVWEIILTYLFIESNSYYTKKSFLQYLIRNIAKKYNLTYKLLLEVIAKGVASEKQSSNQLEFKKIIIELKEDQQKEEISKQTKPFFKKASILEWIEQIDYYLEFGTFKSEFQITSKYDFNRQLEILLQTKNQIFLKKITEWLSHTQKKDMLLLLMSDNVLNQMIKSVSIPFIKESIDFFKAIEENKNLLSANTKALFNDIKEKKSRLILGAFTNRQNTQKETISCFLEEIINEFYNKKFLFLQLLEEVLAKFPIKTQHVVEHFLNTFSQESKNKIQSDFNEGIWKNIINEIKQFTQNNKLEFWNHWITSQLPKWRKKTGIEKQDFIKQLKDRLKNSFISPETISFLENIPVDDGEMEEYFWESIIDEIEEFTKQNETELWNYWIINQLPYWIETTGLEKRDFIKQLKDRLKNSSISPTAISLIENIPVDDSETVEEIWESIIDELEEFTRQNEAELWNYWINNQLAYWTKATSLTHQSFLKKLKEKLANNHTYHDIILQIENKIETNSAQNSDNLTKPNLESINNTNNLSKNNFATKTKQSNSTVSHVILKFLENEIVEITVRVKLFSEWSTEISLLLQKIGERYCIPPKNILKNLILLLEQNTEKKQLVVQLLRLQESQYFIALSNEIQTQQNKQYRQNILTYVLKKGKLPWWNTNYSWSNFNLDFAKLWKSSSTKKSLADTIKKSEQNLQIQIKLNKENLERVWKTLDKSPNKIQATLMIKICRLLKEQLLPIGVVSMQQYNQINEQFFKILQKQHSVQSTESLLFGIIEQFIKSTKAFKNKSTTQLTINTLKQVKLKTESSSFKEKLDKLIEELSIFQEDKSLKLDNKITTIHECIKQFYSAKELQYTTLIDKLDDMIKDSPIEFNQILNKHELRQSLVKELKENDFVKLIRLNINANQERFFIESITIINCSKHFVSSRNFTIFRNQYFMLVLSKLSTGGFSSWTIENWSKLMVQCMENVLGETKSKETLLKINGKLLSDDSNEYKKGITLINQIFMEELKPEIANSEKEEESYKKLGEEVAREFTDPIFTKNTGLILLSPFLGMLFEKCELTSNSEFINDESRSKAVHLLEYAATGQTGKEENELVINKLLCGMSITQPIERDIKLNDKDKETVVSLLSAVTQQWKPLNGTSIDGLRSSFLQRNGKFEEEDEQYYLKVEQKAFDMLLDQIPWNISRIKLSWMKKILLVEWR